MRARLLVGLILVLNGLAGCHYYEEFRSIKGDADIKEEIAEMQKAYRLCLEKYEGDPRAVKEHCSPYAQALRDMESHKPAARPLPGPGK
jgi:hypothetical protein